jgi:hypothetical protein
MSAVSEGFKRWKTRDGWCVCSVPYTCVPGYDLEAATAGLTRDAVEREILLNWAVVHGKKVWEEFAPQRHVAAEPLTLDPYRPIHCGWDWAWTGSPAFVPTQINAHGQWLIFPSLSPTPEEMQGIYQFASDVADHLLRNYAAPHGLGLEDLNLVHIGDPAGRDRPPVTGGRRKEAYSCFEILFRGIRMPMGEDDDGNEVYEEKPGWGWRVIPGARTIPERLEAVRGRLTTTLRDGLPALVVDPRATTVIEAMSGSYAYKEYEDGTYSHDPDKSYWSHTADALGYCATRLWAKGSGSKREGEFAEDREGRVEPYRSQASGYHRH